jgi:multiple antibiotic resistance protein
MPLLSIFLIFFLTIDPFGKISLFNDCLKSEKTPKLIIIRELFFALLFMIAFNFLGESVFSLLSLSETTVRIVSGAILFLVSIRILFPPSEGENIQCIDNVPYVVPLAIPGVASPALLAAIMLFAHLVPDYSTTLIAIISAWALAGCILLFSLEIKKILGNNIIIAIERLMALILMMLAIQRFLDGIRSFIDTQL